MRRADRSLIFDVDDFRPNLTPAELFSGGAFGGAYWRPIHSTVTGLDYEKVYTRYQCLAGIDPDLLARSPPDVSVNKFGVQSGTSLEYWESRGWIAAQDPYGWVQWYCEYYDGRRSSDDARQITRWKNFAGPKGRFRIRAERRPSPVILQGLHQWAYSVS